MTATVATVATETSPYVNLLDPEWYVDPYDAYRWLRRNRNRNPSSR